MLELQAIHRRSAYAARNRSLAMYISATIALVLAFTYASVPLYRIFCAKTGFFGTPQTGHLSEPERLVVSSERRIRISFNADKSDILPWTFAPEMKEVYVRPGETALAFYSAKNTSDKDVIGIATYNVTPDRAAQYFNKIECFCFDEQRLLAGEEVDLPIFFFIDQEFAEDPLLVDVDDIVLSYTFFRAKRNQAGHLVPDPRPGEKPDAPQPDQLR